MRVAFVLRSAEVQPLFRDLCDPLVIKDLLVMCFTYITCLSLIVLSALPILPPLPLYPHTAVCVSKQNTYHYYNIKVL
jgi:hypothetical protein